MAVVPTCRSGGGGEPGRRFSRLSRRADASSDRPYAMSLTRVRISMHKNKKEQGEKEAAEKKKGEEDAARDSIVVVIVCRHPRLAAAAAAAAWSPPTTRLRSCDSGKPKKSANSVAPVQRIAWGRGPPLPRSGPVRFDSSRGVAERSDAARPRLSGERRP